MASKLTRDGIVAQALAVADEKGIAGVTMRAVARELGVEAMSLYHHVKNREGMLDGMVDAVFAEIEIPDGAEASDGTTASDTTASAWRETLAERCRSARAALSRHPWALGLMDSRATPGPATLRHHDAVLGVLRRGGFTVSGAAHAVSLLDAYLYGFVLQELSLPFTAEQGADEVAEQIMPPEAAAAFPYLAELTREHVARPGYDYGAEFEIGLALVLDSLAAVRDAAGRASPTSSSLTSGA
ncbi:TetR/AcrR family transcriptional regulator [Serinibacter salmoneus]|uniref:TetR family transcriptional regulator n=1 Tax=Serinibacter salmoneus TaxID=556530 RepID=A0A2A9D3I7_9MICO|nr:TetR/AcrR family transcriptional regulator [Serinibacter salmoneus]PFG21267.1 TetR family transcriptional regulator [Serinibacter salmoneus]